MALRSYRHHRFPPPIIQHAIWLYLRFTLSYVEDLLTEHGFRVETAAQWLDTVAATWDLISPCPPFDPLLVP
jgi:transposase-like protein